MSQGRIFSYISSKRPIWDSGKEYRTLYRYEAQEEDELSLEEGQVRPHSVPAGGHLYISLNPLWHPTPCISHCALRLVRESGEQADDWWQLVAGRAQRPEGPLPSLLRQERNLPGVAQLSGSGQWRAVTPERPGGWNNVYSGKKNYVVFTVILRNRTLYRPLVWLEISPIFTEVGRPWQGRRGGLVERWTAGGNWSLSVFLCRGIVNQNQH